MTGAGLRIAFDGLLLGGHESGVERYSRYLLRSLDHACPGDIAVEVFCRPGALGEGWRSLRSRPVRWVAEARWRRACWQQLVFPLRLRERFDVVHAPAYVAPLAARIPVVLTVHDLIALERPDLCARANVLHYGRMLPRSVRRAARVIVPSHWIRQRLLAHFGLPAQRVVTIYEGVRDLFRTAPSPSELAAVRERWPLDGRILLFVGNLEPKKNLVRLIEAFAALKCRHADLKLVLCGRQAWRSGALREALRRSPFRDDVVLTGHVPDAVVHALYHLAQVFVFPSLTEGFGMPPLEAMASGTPVVAGGAPAVAEVSGPAALTVDTEDGETLEGALRRVLESEDLRAELRERGRVHSQRFRWEHAAAETIDVYRAAAAG